MKPGPVPVEIDIKLVGNLAAIQCTLEEIAAVIGLNRTYFLERVAANPDLRAAIDNGKAQGRSSIRRQQFKLLEAGNATMGIWLGKQYLGQRDQILHGEDAANPISQDEREALRSRVAGIAGRLAGTTSQPN